MNPTIQLKQATEIRSLSTQPDTDLGWPGGTLLGQQPGNWAKVLLTRYLKFPPDARVDFGSIAEDYFSRFMPYAEGHGNRLLLFFRNHREIRPVNFQLRGPTGMFPCQLNCDAGGAEHAVIEVLTERTEDGTGAVALPWNRLMIGVLIPRQSNPATPVQLADALRDWNSIYGVRSPILAPVALAGGVLAYWRSSPDPNVSFAWIGRGTEEQLISISRNFHSAGQQAVFIPKGIPARPRTRARG